MNKRIKRIFISDIHLSDRKSMSQPHPYAWFHKNVHLLEDFLQEQLDAGDIKEVVILGDLFETWLVPTYWSPDVSLADICSNPCNQGVVRKLRSLAASGDVKLAYAPGNHDMPMNAAAISATRRFLEETFPGIRFICNPTVPLGTYRVGPLVAEHGNRYALFNAPDTWTNPDTFLPLGYFISRMVTYKVSQTGHKQDPRRILFKFIYKYQKQSSFIPTLFEAVAKDVGLAMTDTIDMSGIPGYPDRVALGTIRDQFAQLLSDWRNTPGHVNAAAAVLGDAGNLWPAAAGEYFTPMSDTPIVLFGHTHGPDLYPQFRDDPFAGGSMDPNANPCLRIYANCGSWVDHGKSCTYVETEEISDGIHSRGTQGNLLEKVSLQPFQNPLGAFLARCAKKDVAGCLGGWSPGLGRWELQHEIQGIDLRIPCERVPLTNAVIGYGLRNIHPIGALSGVL